MKILIVVWARPNFMKVAPIIAYIEKHTSIEYVLLHTWQHFDKSMSENIFHDLWLPEPHINLNIHGGTSCEQIGRIMIEFDKVVKEELPDYVLVVWDVNSTFACAVTAKHNGIKVIHVEAGLRSRDMTMPEEINRILTDSITDLYFVTEDEAVDNLKSEWKEEQVHLVGNVMIDCLISQLPAIDKRQTLADLWVSPKKYALVTLHRPSNVDTAENLVKYLSYFTELADRLPIVISLHPRTVWAIEKFQLQSYLDHPSIVQTGPQWYLDFIHLVKNSVFVLTDSGGVQEETTYLQIPCLTMRENTERPVTCILGSNILVGSDFDTITTHIDSILNGSYKKWVIPPLRDDQTSARIITKVLEDYASTWEAA